MINELKQWAIKYDIEKISLASFWLSFNNYIEEDSSEFREVFGDDFDHAFLTVNMESVALFLDKWNETKDNELLSYGFDYVVSYIPIVYKTKKIGLYKLLFTLEGEVFDDFFILE
ncbi:hypothetical protein SAMN04487969_116110 [Paenibacillus algorifonticola]|uniref:Uncharacterized protein n=1 Tax=Paenibacillus algorifonticola TaxID=684063 RepID=A0A1I2GJN8_9BACL|nr:hypothetical protein [Paenibacillus algorifonticola]SFF17458.1 hypothetical protein SAMN04487969_116110 [Paenibacillus algorifonticola]